MLAGCRGVSNARGIIELFDFSNTLPRVFHCAVFFYFANAEIKKYIACGFVWDMGPEIQFPRSHTCGMWVKQNLAFCPETNPPQRFRPKGSARGEGDRASGGGG